MLPDFRFPNEKLFGSKKFDQYVRYIGLLLQSTFVKGGGGLVLLTGWWAKPFLG